MWAVTDLDPELLRKANITPKKSVEEAVRDALALKPEGRLIVLAEGSVTIPRPMKE